jgi:hypothetical protein
MQSLEEVMTQMVFVLFSFLMIGEVCFGVRWLGRVVLVWVCFCERISKVEKDERSRALTDVLVRNESVQ